jgi:type IV pilus assembly protein PilA
MRPHRSHAGERGVTAVEAAVIFAITGSLLAIAVPAFLRETRASRFVEPVEGLEKIGSGALAYAANKPAASAFPASAPLTPPSIPRGTREADPPGVWDHPTWKALAFRPTAEGVPHAFSFGFDATPGGARSSFVAHAHGDLDGDGVRSSFELRGHAQDGEEAALDPGMYVESEVE